MNKMFLNELYSLEGLYSFIEKVCTVLYSTLNCQNVAKYTQFYLRELRFTVTFTSIAGCNAGICNGIPNVTLWQVLHLDYFLSCRI
jgi:hypothetical protein